VYAIATSGLADFGRALLIELNMVDHHR
jgi:hypothetical protein